MDVNYRTEDSLRSDAERFVASLDWTNEDAVYVVPSFAVSRPLATATIPIDKKVLLQHLLYGRVSQVLLVVLVPCEFVLIRHLRRTGTRRLIPWILRR